MQPCKKKNLSEPETTISFLKLIQYNLNGSNTDSSFTVDGSNSFFSPYKILPKAQENKYLWIFSYLILELYEWVYSIESPHRGDSNEYTQHAIVV